jgi:hypothetical protein
MKISYCTISIQWQLTGQDWGKDANKFLFRFLNQNIISESYSTGLVQVQTIIDNFVKTEITTLAEAVSELEACFYASEGGDLLYNEDMLRQVILKLNPILK